MKLFESIKQVTKHENTIVQAHQDENQKKILKKISSRFTLIMIAFLVLMIPIVLRLYDIQIRDHQRFIQKAISQFDTTKTQLSARGEIVDRNGQVLVSNQERLSFIYLEPQQETAKSKFQKAVNFVAMFGANIDPMTFREKQDAYLHFYPERGQKLITEEENKKFKANALTDKDLYRLKLSRITREIINRELSELQLKQFYTYIIMQNAIGLDVVLKESVTPQEVNLLLENSEKFTGIEVRTNWDRQSTGIHKLGSILGDISTNRQGLPRELSNYYLAKNYKLNERVGKSGIEQTYEDILAGKRTIYNLKYNNEGFASLAELFPGQKGDTLSLTIDVDFQNKVDQIITDHLLKFSGKSNHEFFKEMQVVVSNPNNGEVLAMSGVSLNNKREPIYQASSPFLKSYKVGSSIKGSVVYMALDEKVFYPGQKVLDEVIKIKGTPAKKSSAILGWVNDLEALSKSSNVYMFKAVIGLGNGVYRRNEALNLNQYAYDKVRLNYSRFGLGVSTGLDVPFEETGYKSSVQAPGYLLDNVIGQFDTFTAAQLNQYVSTIANGKYRYKLRLVNNSYDAESGLISFQNTPTILNSIDNEMAISRVKKGFRLCVTDGYCRGFYDAKMPTAAKTGTAEDMLYIDGRRIDTVTNTITAYAPFDKPEIAISCVAPHFRQLKLTENGCEAVVKSVINAYADMKK